MVFVKIYNSTANKHKRLIRLLSTNSSLFGIESPPPRTENGSFRVGAPCSNVLVVARANLSRQAEESQRAPVQSEELLATMYPYSLAVVCAQKLLYRCFACFVCVCLLSLSLSLSTSRLGLET